MGHSSRKFKVVFPYSVQSIFKNGTIYPNSYTIQLPPMSHSLSNDLSEMKLLNGKIIQQLVKSKLG